MYVSLMRNGYSQCAICHYHRDVFLNYAIFVTECEVTSTHDDILSSVNTELRKNFNLVPVL